MTKRAESKYKINRRLNVNLWGRAKSPSAARIRPRPARPARRKPSDFGPASRQAKLKGYYGTSPSASSVAIARPRRTGDLENLVGLLERRLDAVAYRMKFVPTVFAARQFVSHGHLKVNGRRVNIASYLVKDGDVIEVKDASKQLAIVLSASESAERDVPDYIQVDHRAMKGTFVRTPKLGDVPYPVQMEPNLVVEFYSR